jgi:hypothetical protein
MRPSRDVVLQTELMGTSDWMQSFSGGFFLNKIFKFSVQYKALNFLTAEEQLGIYLDLTEGRSSSLSCDRSIASL